MHLASHPVQVRYEGIEFGEIGDAPDGMLILVDEDHHAALSIGTDAHVELVECAGRGFGSRGFHFGLRRDRYNGSACGLFRRMAGCCTVRRLPGKE
jgi:hypothetical protein